MNHIAYYASPLGLMEIQGTEEAITSVIFLEDATACPEPSLQPPSVITTCIEQLEQYFAGTRFSFTIPVKTTGTSFQRQVWECLDSIPLGSTITYKTIAVSSGNERAVRAVGNAVGQNRIAVIIPCHRVIGSGAELRGYAWGVWRKEWLLRHEQSCTPQK